MKHLSDNQRIVNRNGILYTLTIDKYEGQNCLAYDQTGKPWLKKGRGKWQPAKLTVR